MTTATQQPMSQQDAIPQAAYANGRVTNVNDRGMQLSGSEGWFNVSKFVTAPLTMPAVGDDVQLALDRSGYIRAISLTSHPAVQPPVSAALARVDAALGNPDAELRLQCLKMVVSMANGISDPLPTVDAYLTLASVVERWARGQA